VEILLRAQPTKGFKKEQKIAHSPPDHIWKKALFMTGDWAFHILNVGEATQVAPTPIPGAVWLLGSGLAGIVAGRRYKK